MIEIPSGPTTRSSDDRLCKSTQDVVHDLVLTLRLRRNGAISRRIFLKRWGELRTLLAQTAEYKKLRKYVAWRAGGTCQVMECGRKGELIHHVRQVSKAPELVLDRSNVIWICRRCHKKIHPHLQRS